MDPTLVPRWLMIFGLALITTVAFIAVMFLLAAAPPAVTWALFV